MTALDTDTKQSASLPPEKQRTPLTESLSGYNLLEHKGVDSFVRRKDLFVRQALAHLSQALQQCQDVMQEADFIEEERAFLVETLDRQVLSLQCFEFLEGLSEIKGFSKGPKKDAARRKIARMFGVKGEKLTDNDVKVGEQLRDLGNRIFGDGFKSITPSTILKEELPAVMGSFSTDVGEDAAEALKSRRDAHAKRYFESIGVRSREGVDGNVVFDQVPKSVAVDLGGSKDSRSLRYKYTLRRSRPTPHAGHGYTPEDDKKNSDTASQKRQSKKVLELVGQLHGDFAKLIKSGAFKDIRDGIDGLAKSLRVLHGESVVSVAPELLAQLDEWSKSFEAGATGDSGDYRRSVNHVLDNVATLQESLLAIADELESHYENPRLLRAAKSQEELRELALDHLATIESRTPIQNTTFAGHDDRVINRDLIHAICEYNFALEQGDDARAENSFQVANGFQRREVREALQVLYYDHELIAESTYQTLREECGEHREAPVKPPEFTEEELAAQRKADDERSEQIELSEMALADYCNDPEECARLAHIVMPETIDYVLASLSNSLQGKDLRELLLIQNPRIFEIAETDRRQFSTYAYKLLMHTADVVRRYESGELNLARYSDPSTIVDVIEADQKSEQRQAKRESLANSVEANGFCFEAVSAIFLVGFADGDGGLHTSATTHISHTEVFEKLAAGLSNYAEHEPLLREEFKKLLAANAIVGSSAVAIGTNWTKKKAMPNPAILKQLIQFLLGEEAPQLPVTLAVE